MHTNNSIIILQLQLFLVTANYEISKITNFKLKNTENETVLINSKMYKVVSVIFHHGSSIESGHYTNMLRKNNNWLRINDKQMRQEEWPQHAMDAYILFLEEIMTKSETCRIRSYKDDLNVVKNLPIPKQKDFSVIISDTSDNNSKRIPLGKLQKNVTHDIKPLNLRTKKESCLSQNDNNDKQLHFDNMVASEHSANKCSQNIQPSGECSITDKKNKLKRKVLSSLEGQSNLQCDNDVTANNAKSKKIKFDLLNLQGLRECVGLSQHLTTSSNTTLNSYTIKKPDIFNSNVHVPPNNSLESVSQFKSTNINKCDSNTISNYNHDYYKLNRERILARNKLNYRLKKNEINERKRSIYKINKKEICMKKGLYYKSHKEKISQLRRKYYEQNREKLLVRSKFKLANKIKKKYVLSMHLNTIKLLKMKEKYVRNLMEK